MPEQTDRQTTLVRQAIDGDADAFGELYMQHLDAIYRYIFFRVKNVDDVEDLTEQVFLKAWEALPNYEPSGYPLSSWLYRIAHNVVVDHYRRRKPVEVMSLPEEPTWESMDTTSLDKIIKAEEASMLAEAITKLPEVQQQVIILRFIEGMDHAEIADILEKSNGACRTIQYRALNTLNVLLSDVKEGR